MTVTEAQHSMKCSATSTRVNTSVKKCRCRHQSMTFYDFFFETPTVRPRRPVVLVCWPLTRRLQPDFTHNNQSNCEYITHKDTDAAGWHGKLRCQSRVYLQTLRLEAWV